MNSKRILAGVVAAGIFCVLAWAALRWSNHERREDGFRVEPIHADSPNASTSNDSHKSEAASATLVSATPAISIAATPQDLQRMQVLNEILKSGNDNDPRLDSDFRNLSPVSKKLMRDRYQTIPMERRNERGTIVFLLGREIANSEDVAFLGSVMDESPCLSLSDCTREEKQTDREHLHHEAGADVTLNYPQMVTLSQIEKQIERAEKGEKLPTLDDLRKVVEEASHSPVGLVAEKAQALRERLKNLKA